MDKDPPLLAFEDVPSLVMFSAGIDSYTLLKLVKQQVNAPVEALFFTVGQESAKRQLEFASRACNELDVRLTHLHIPGYRDLYAGYIDPPHPLVAEGTFLGPTPSYPLMLLACYRAALLGMQMVYRGMITEDLSSDAQTQRFLDLCKLVEQTIQLARPDSSVRFRNPFLEASLSGSDVVRLGYESGLNPAQSWSCQWGNRFHCGRCMACVKRKKALATHGTDPTFYVDYPGTERVTDTTSLEGTISG